MHQSLRPEDRGDARLSAALERRPEVEIPAAFAARVARRALEEFPTRHTAAEAAPRPSRVGVWTARAGLAVLLLLMLVLARAAVGQGGPGKFLAECVLAGEFAALAMWVMVAPTQRGSR